MGYPKWYADGRIVCTMGKQDCAEIGLEGRAEKICEWHNSEVAALQSALAAEVKRREAAEERVKKWECGEIAAMGDDFGDSPIEVIKAHRANAARLREALAVCEDENQRYLKDKLYAEAALEKIGGMQIVETLPIIEAVLHPAGAKEEE